MVSEVEFVSIICMLQNGSKKLSPTLHDLLSHDRLPPIMTSNGKAILDIISTRDVEENRKVNAAITSNWKWLIPYDNVHRCLSDYCGSHSVDNNQLWTVSRSVVNKICEEKGKGKKDGWLEM